MALGSLRNLGAPNAPSGEYVNPGNAAQNVRNLGIVGDNIRGLFRDVPLMAVSLIVLYHLAYQSNDPDRTWGVGDVLGIVVTAYALKRFGVARRWGK